MIRRVIWGARDRRAVKGHGGWTCRAGGEANDARACMDRDTDRPGAMARGQPPGKREKPWRSGNGEELRREIDSPPRS